MTTHNQPTRKVGPLVGCVVSSSLTSFFFSSQVTSKISLTAAFPHPSSSDANFSSIFCSTSSNLLLSVSWLCWHGISCCTISILTVVFVLKITLIEMEVFNAMASQSSWSSSQWEGSKSWSASSSKVDCSSTGMRCPPSASPEASSASLLLASDWLLVDPSSSLLDGVSFCVCLFFPRFLLLISSVLLLLLNHYDQGFQPVQCVRNLVH